MLIAASFSINCLPICSFSQFSFMVPSEWCSVQKLVIIASSFSLPHHIHSFTKFSLFYFQNISWMLWVSPTISQPLAWTLSTLAPLGFLFHMVVKAICSSHYMLRVKYECLLWLVWFLATFPLYILPFYTHSALAIMVSLCLKYTNLFPSRQGLWTCCSFCMAYSSLDLSISLLKNYIPNEIFSDHHS